MDNYRNKFNPNLIFAGVEGDWTECTDWILDNSIVTINMLNTLEMLIKCLKRLQTLKKPSRTLNSPSLNSFKVGNIDVNKYQNIFDGMKDALNSPVENGGLWSKEKGYLIHGNDGKGEIIHGDKYFESTSNYFALLWNLLNEENTNSLWQYIEEYKEKIEEPYPVLTNFMPRTGARRKNYGKTVTNGDVWMVLGSHAAAARLQAGYIEQGSKMYEKIIQYEQDNGVLHNCIYQNGTVNDSWDPEIGNYGALYAAFVYGILGAKPRADGIDFNFRPLLGMTTLKTKLFLFNTPYLLDLNWKDGKFSESTITNLSTLKKEKITQFFHLSL